MNLRYPDLAALMLRLGFGLTMLFGHGLSKFLMLLSGEIKFIALFGMPPTLSLVLAVISEFFACILIIIGYKTRVASIPIMLTMIIAAFWVHGNDPLFTAAADGGGAKEPALIYLIGFMSIYLLGSGKYSVDDKYDSVL